MYTTYWQAIASLRLREYPVCLGPLPKRRKLRGRSAARETWQRPQLVDSVRTLLSLGADPNYTNGHRDSFAMGNAVHGSAHTHYSVGAGGEPQNDLKDLPNHGRRFINQ
jgi:hypothetical protein